MTQAIRVDSRFATPYRTARVLGVSKSRTKELIELARQFTDRLLDPRESKLRKFRAGASKNGSISRAHARRKSAASVLRKGSSPDGGSKISTTKAKGTKAKR